MLRALQENAEQVSGILILEQTVFSIRHLAGMPTGKQAAGDIGPALPNEHVSPAAVSATPPARRQGRVLLIVDIPIASQQNFETLLRHRRKQPAVCGPHQKTAASPLARAGWTAVSDIFAADLTR